jgi:hypothetical protein
MNLDRTKRPNDGLTFFETPRANVPTMELSARINKRYPRPSIGFMSLRIIVPRVHAMDTAQPRANSNTSLIGHDLMRIGVRGSCFTNLLCTPIRCLSEQHLKHVMQHMERVHTSFVLTDLHAIPNYQSNTTRAHARISCQLPVD